MPAPNRLDEIGTLIRALIDNPFLLHRPAFPVELHDFIRVVSHADPAFRCRGIIAQSGR